MNTHANKYLSTIIFSESKTIGSSLFVYCEAILALRYKGESVPEIQSVGFPFANRE